MSLKSDPKYLEINSASSSFMEKMDQLNAYAWEISRLEIEKALSIAKDNVDQCVYEGYEKGEADAQKVIAQCFWLLGDYKEALKSIERGKDLYTKLGDEYGSAAILNLHGAIYSKMKDFEKSIDLYQASLEIRKRIGDKEGEVRALNSIGDSLMQMDQVTQALKFFEASAKVEHDDVMYKSIVLYNLAEANHLLGNHKNAIQYLQECQGLQQDKKFPLKDVYVMQLTAKIRLAQSKWDEAIRVLEAALEMANSIQAKDRVYSTYELLAKAFEGKGQFEDALKYFKKFTKLKEEVVNKELGERIKTIEYRNEMKAVRQEHEIEKLKNVKLKAANAEIRRQKNELSEKNKEIFDSIYYAKRIQSAMLPSDKMIQEYLPDSFIYFHPKDVLSGDFYWISDVVTNKKEDLIVVAVADCTGHGIPGALMSIVGNSFLRLCETETTVNNPGEALDFIHKGLQKTLRQETGEQKIKDGMDMTFLAIDYNDMKIYFAGAKNPMYLIRGEELIEIKGDRQPIGFSNEYGFLKFTNHTLKIEKGDCIYLFTDGFQDQFGGPKGKKFKVKQFKEMLKQNSSLPMTQQKEEINDRFTSWKGDMEQVDDVCVFGVRI